MLELRRTRREDTKDTNTTARASAAGPRQHDHGSMASTGDLAMVGQGQAGLHCLSCDFAMAGQGLTGLPCLASHLAMDEQGLAGLPCQVDHLAMVGHFVPVLSYVAGHLC